MPSGPTPLVAIGDVQGCLDELLQLEAAIPPARRLLFLGDLVNRGPRSADTLRHVRAMGERATAVLGNHDLHLLAVVAGIRPMHRDDTIGGILEANDRDTLIDWLRARPLAVTDQGALFVHAGVLPDWDAATTLELAAEVEAQLRGAEWRAFLRTMYGNSPARWDPGLRGADRARCIINALTRMRFLRADGSMDLANKDTAGAAPDGSVSWFDHPRRATRGVPVVFGHWSALGLLLREDAVCLDTGCVWGGRLSAITWPGRELVQVESRQPRLFS